MNKILSTLQGVLDEMRLGFNSIEKRLEGVDQKLDEIWVKQVDMSEKVDVIYDQVVQHTENEDIQRKINSKVEEQLENHDTRIKILEFPYVKKHA